MDPWLGTWHNFHQPSYYSLPLDLRNHQSKFQNARTPLFYVSKETRQLLIDFGANIENDDDDSRTPLLEELFERRKSVDFW